MLLVAKIFGDGQGGERHAPARARRLVHLAVDQHGMRQHARALHVGQHFVPLARALADAGEHGNALVFLDHGMDQFHHQHGLADARAAEHRGLAALRERRQQIDHLDAGLEHRHRRGLVLESGRRAWMPRRGVSAGSAGPSSLNVPTTSSKRPRTASPTGTEIGVAGRLDFDAARQSFGRLKRDAAHGDGIDVAVDFEDQRFCSVPFDDHGRVDGRRFRVAEPHVDHGAANRQHGPFGRDRLGRRRDRVHALATFLGTWA